MKKSRLLKKYYKSNGFGWDIFWNYMCCQKENSIEKFCFITQLYAYLINFGMGRNNSELINGSALVLEGVYDVINTNLYRFRELRFGSLRFKKKSLLSAIEKLRNALYEKGVSATDTMVTKILLGVTGETPAFDSNLKAAIRYFNLKCPTNYFNAITVIEEQYDKSWKFEIENLLVEDKSLFRTRIGNSNIVPRGKIIDSALWRKGFIINRK